MGAKSERKRNFENGILTDDPALVDPLVEQFDSVWRNAPVPQASGSPTSVARSFAKQSRKRVRDFCRENSPAPQASGCPKERDAPAP